LQVTTVSKKKNFIQNFPLKINRLNQLSELIMKLTCLNFTKVTRKYECFGRIVEPWLRNQTNHQYHSEKTWNWWCDEFASSIFLQNSSNFLVSFWYFLNYTFVSCWCERYVSSRTISWCKVTSSYQDVQPNILQKWLANASVLVAL
jgi:hypothetical protein